MKKFDLIKELAAETGLTEAVVHATLDTLCDIVVAAIARGDHVRLAGLGKLHAVNRGRRVARDIRRGTTILVEPGRVAKLVPSVRLARAAKGAAQ